MRRSGDRACGQAAGRHAQREGEAEADGFRAQHLDLATAQILTDSGAVRVLVNESESPLAWLARRKGRDGQAMIGPQQFLAGERLRADFTRANMSPRVTSSWAAPTGNRSGSSGPGQMTDLIVAARQRVRGGLRPGIRGPANGRMLFSSRSGGCRARTGLAVAVSQDRTATRARSPGAALRSDQRNIGARQRAHQDLARRRCGIQQRVAALRTRRPALRVHRYGCARPSSASRWSAAA